MHQQQDNNFKPARLANGIEVMVPQFVKTGDVIRLDLADHEVHGSRQDGREGEARVAACQALGPPDPPPHSP